MSMVRFATTCDVTIGTDKKNLVDIKCGKRSEEYTAWPFCRKCDNHSCEQHQRPGTKTDADVDSPETCICVECDE